jgi:hypothetical protein
MSKADHTCLAAMEWPNTRHPTNILVSIQRPTVAETGYTRPKGGLSRPLVMGLFVGNPGARTVSATSLLTGRAGRVLGRRTCLWAP